MNRLVFCFFVVLIGLSFDAFANTMSQCELQYVVSGNQTAENILQKKFDFTKQEAQVLLSDPRLNQTVLDLLLAQSELLDGVHLKGNVYNSLIKEMKTPDYHETNSEDEEMVLMLSLHAADLWPINLDAIVGKTRLVNDTLAKENVKVSRPAFELLVAAISRYNFHEIYAPTFSKEHIRQRKETLLSSLSKSEQLNYFSEQVKAYPVGSRKALADMARGYQNKLSSYSLDTILSPNRDNKSVAKTNVERRLFAGGLERTQKALNTTDLQSYFQFASAALGYFGEKSHGSSREIFASIESPVMLLLYSGDLPKKSWKDWTLFYEQKIKPAEVNEIKTQGGQIPEFYFEIEKEFLRLVVKPSNVDNISPKELKSNIASLLRRKFAELQSLAQFELQFKNTIPEERVFEENETPQEVQLLPSQVRYIIPEKKIDKLQPEELAKDLVAMTKYISQFGVNVKIGEDIAQHFAIRDVKYRRIFLKTLIALVEGQGFAIPAGTKELATESGEIYEFNRLGSYRLFFAFYNQNLILLEVDHVKDGATLQSQQRAILLSEKRFSEFLIRNKLKKRTLQPTFHAPNILNYSLNTDRGL